MLLPDLLARSADEAPEKDAAVFPAEKTTFAALETAANQVARRLGALGIGPGKRVALIGENSLAGLIWFWGVLKTGAASVDIPTLAGISMIETTLAESKPDALALNARQAKRLKDHGWKFRPRVLLGARELGAVLEDTPFVALEDILASENKARVRPAVSPHDVASIIYTSGTTGRPKGVMLSHANLYSNLIAFNRRLRLGRSDSILVVVPLYYIHGRIQLLTHALIGGTCYFSAGFQFPKTVLDELVKYGCTGISGVPFHFATLMGQTKLKSTSLPALKNMIITGGAMSPAQLQELAAAVPGIRLHLNYGQTESSPRLTYLGPDELSERPTSCGRPIPGVKIEILDPEGRALPPGEVGEVVATTPGLMRGYVSGDERSSGRIDEQGRLRTGDLGKLDGEGYLFLAGRSSEMLKTAGERISPREIEEILEVLPGVRECAVLGIPDPILGERIVALLVVDPARPPALLELKQRSLKQLPFVRLPREFRLVAELPKTSSGKIRRGELQALFAEAAPLK